MRIFFLVLTLVLSTASITEPLYWRAQKGNLDFLIFGSVHVGDGSMYPLPNYITNFLTNSDGLIIEADVTNTVGVQYPSVTLTSKDVLNESQLAELKGIANLLNLNTQQLIMSPPWATALTIQMKQIDYLGYKASDGVDLHLLSKARAQLLPILPLESLQFQIDILTGQKEGGKELLVSAIEEFDHSEDATICLIESWKAGDLEKLNEFSQLSEMSPEFERAFLTDRNIAWTKQLENPSWAAKKRGRYLMVVGALHLIGKQSVLELLKGRGFRVEQLSTSEQAHCEFER